MKTRGKVYRRRTKNRRRCMRKGGTIGTFMKDLYKNGARSVYRNMKHRGLGLNTTTEEKSDDQKRREEKWFEYLVKNARKMLATDEREHNYELLTYQSMLKAHSHHFTQSDAEKQARLYLSIVKQENDPPSIG